MAQKLDVALGASDTLGEGPWWDTTTGELWRVDILDGRAHRWNPTTHETAEWDLGEDVGFVVPARDGQLIAGRRTEVSIIDLSNTEITTLVRTPGSTAARLNDGKADRAGRVWAGTIVDDQTNPQAVFGKIDNGEFVVALGGLLISNGLGWSPDDTTMYVTDSGVKTIWAFDYDIEHGELSNQRVFATDTDCAPDGLTVDAEGGVWSAKWDGARVVRYDEDGSISAVIEASATRLTSCAFGGSELDTLFVTSASVGLDVAEVSTTGAGSVFAIQPGVLGLPERRAVL